MLPDRLSTAFQTAARGLSVQRERINVASRNIANVNTSSTEGSRNAYKPQSVKSYGPKPANFKNVLTESLTSLRKTDERHLSAPQTNGKMPQAQNPGPTFEVTESDSFRYEYDPNHPDANEEGMVRYPDIDLVREMTQMVSANRLYEANLSSIEAEKEIMKRSMQI